MAANLRLSQVLLVRFGDTEGARDALARALDLDPANDEAALHLFEAHVDAGREPEALSVLERHLDARPQRPEHAPLRLRGAEMAIAAGQQGRARRMLEAALREAPGFTPAARALLPLLESAGDWPQLIEMLQAVASSERDPAARASLLLRAAEVALEPVGDSAEAMRILAWAIVTEPARMAARRQLEAVAARSGDFSGLARAFLAGAAAAGDDLGSRKALLRRAAEIEEHDLGHAEEAARVWRMLADLDPADRGAASAYEAALSRAGRQAELIEDLSGRLATASEADRRELSIKIARLHLEAGDAPRAEAAWRDVLAQDGTDPEALRGLATALRADVTEAGAAELCQVLARLSAQGAPDRAELEAERAALLLQPLARPLDSAGAWLALLEGGGLAPPLASQAVRALEALLASGIDPVRIARALAPVHAAAGDAGRHVEMLEVIARDESANPSDRARMWLDVSAIRQDRLGDARGALDAAAAALREAPSHPEARRRVEDLATRARAYAELHALLAQAADALSGQPAEERSLRIRAAQLAEEELGSQEQAAVQLRRVREIVPGDPDALAGLTRLALAGERWAEARDLLAEREGLEPPPAERAALATQRGDLSLERLHDPVAAVAAYRCALGFVPREQSARLLARTARALEAAEDRAGLAEVLDELAHHPNLPPGLDLPTLPPPTDPLERLELTRERLARDPHDVAAAAEMEQLATELDRPADLAWVLEQRLAAALFDSDLAFRIAELRRRRLGDPPGALRMLAEVAASDPDHPGVRLSLLQMARETGALGRDALAQVDQVFASAQDVETRLTVREDRLAIEEDPAERAHLQGEIRTLLEVDLGDPSRALDAARGAFAAGGREREDALADIPRLAEKAGRIDVLADVYAAAAESTVGAAASDYLRLSARTRERTGDVSAQVTAWRRLSAAVPDDVEPLEALDRILSRERRTDELVPILAELAEARRNDPARRLEVLLRRAVLLEGAEDAQASVDAFAAVLGEFPQEGAALAGLARALARPAPARPRPGCSRRSTGPPGTATSSPTCSSCVSRTCLPGSGPPRWPSWRGCARDPGGSARPSRPGRASTRSNAGIRPPSRGCAGSYAGSPTRPGPRTGWSRSSRARWSRGCPRRPPSRPSPRWRASTAPARPGRRWSRRCGAGPAWSATSAFAGTSGGRWPRSRATGWATPTLHGRRGARWPSFSTRRATRPPPDRAEPRRPPTRGCGPDDPHGPARRRRRRGRLAARRARGGSGPRRGARRGGGALAAAGAPRGQCRLLRRRPLRGDRRGRDVGEGRRRGRAPDEAGRAPGRASPGRGWRPRAPRGGAGPSPWPRRGAGAGRACHGPRPGAGRGDPGKGLHRQRKARAARRAAHRAPSAAGRGRWLGRAEARRAPRGSAGAPVRCAALLRGGPPARPDPRTPRARGAGAALPEARALRRPRDDAGGAGRVRGPAGGAHRPPLRPRPALRGAAFVPRTGRRRLPPDPRRATRPPGIPARAGQDRRGSRGHRPRALDPALGAALPLERGRPAAARRAAPAPGRARRPGRPGRHAPQAHPLRAEGRAGAAALPRRVAASPRATLPPWRRKGGA